MYNYIIGIISIIFQHVHVYSTCYNPSINLVMYDYEYLFDVYVFIVFVNSSKYFVLHIIVILCPVVCLLSLFLFKSCLVHTSCITFVPYNNTFIYFVP